MIRSLLFNMMYILLFIVLWSPDTYSQEIYAEEIIPSGIRTLQYESSFKNVLKDHLGYIWITSDDGLFRYDGYELYQYTIDATNPNSLPYEELQSIAQDSNYNLWIGTSNNGLLHFDYETEVFSEFKTENPDSDSFKWVMVTDLTVDASGKLWILPAYGKIYTYDIGKDLLKVEELSTERYGKNSNNYKSLLLQDQSIALLINNSLLLGSSETGFKEYKKSGSNLQHSSIIELSDGNLLTGLWIAEEGYTFDRNTEEYIKNNLDGYIYGFHDRDSCSVWVSSAGDLQIYNYCEERIEGQLSEDVIRSSEYDPNGNLIGVTTDGKLKKYFTGSSVFQIHQEQVYSKILPYKNGQYIGLTDRRIDLISEDLTEASTLYEKSDKYFFHNIHVDHEYTIWLSGSVIKTLDDGSNFSYPNSILTEIDSVMKEVGVYDNVPFFDQMESIKGDSIGVNSKIYSLAPYIDGFFSVTNRLAQAMPDQEIWHYSKHFEEDNEGHIWISTVNHGVVKLDSSFNVLNSYLQATDDCPTVFNDHYYLMQMRSGRLLLLAKTAILEYQKSSDCFEVISHDLPFKEYSFLGYHEDNSGNLWFISENEIVFLDLDKTEYRRFDLDPRYRLTNIHLIELFSIGTNRVLLTTESGLVSLDLDKLQHTQEYYEIDIHRFSINNTDVTVDSEVFSNHIRNTDFVQLPHDKKDLRFDFVAPEACNDQVDYYTILDDGYQNWSLSNERFAEYKNVQPGTYDFRVELRNKANDKLEGSKSIEIVIDPPWYKSTLAYMIYIALILGVLYLLHLLRIRQLNRFHSLRSRISEDLHDDVGTLLSAIAMQSEILGLEANESKKGKFDKLSLMARNAMGNMRDTVWAIDARRDNVKSLVYRMQDFLYDILEGHALQYVFAYNEESFETKLNPVIRQGLYLIFKEAVTNAAKHSNGDFMKIKLQVRGTNFLLSIHDNGDSFQASKKTSSGLGLTSMKRRAEKIGARYTIDYKDGFLIKIQSS